MATQDYAASIQGVSIRVTRLDAAGNLLNGAGDSYVTSAFMRVSFTPEYEEGDEIVEKGANGVICVSYKAPDTLKLISGGLLLRKTVDGESKSVGWAAPGVGDDPAGNGVSIEVWSHAVKDGKRASVLPYFHWVFPYVKLRQSGDRVIENGMLANTFEGYGLGNARFGAGVDGRWEFPVAAERPYSYARADWAPQGLKGFYTWSDDKPQQIFFTKSGIQGATAQTITSITANTTTATVTFDNTIANIGIVDGDYIVVSGVGDAFDTASQGVVAAVANANASIVTYTVANVGTTPITATLDKFSRVTLVESVTEDPDYTVVSTSDLDTAYANGTGTATYNVPGAANYNPDANVDFIIKSNED
jgi:hypothetical protein